MHQTLSSQSGFLKVINYIKKHKTMFMLLLAAVIVNLTAIFNNSGSTLNPMGVFLNFSAVICFFLFLFFIAYRVFGKIGLWLLYAFYLPSLLIDSFMKISYGSYTTLDNLKALINTNYAESFDFFLQFRAGFIFVFLLFLLFTFVITVIYRSLKNFSIKKRYIVLALVGFIAFQASTFFFDKYIRYSNHSFVKHIARGKILKAPPVNPYFRMQEYVKVVAKQKKYMAKRQVFEFEIDSITASNNKIVVLMIGEGMRFANWGINGYERKTSIAIDTLENLLSYKKHYSNATSTSASIPLILTRATPSDVNKAYSEKSIISLFKQAGYYSVWLSNQDINYLDNEDEPNEYVFIKSDSDLALAPLFQDIFNKNSEKNLFVLINLRGNHGNSDFKINQFNGKALNKTRPTGNPDNKGEILDYYDHIIIEQSVLIYEIYKTFENRDGVIFYTSDHALEIFDDEKKPVYGYGSGRVNQIETHIPFFVLYSNSFEEFNEEKTINAKNNSNSISSNTDVFYSLADAGGINIKGNEEYSLFSSKKKSEKFVLLSMGREALKLQLDD